MKRPYIAHIESITDNYITVVLFEPYNKTAWLELSAEWRRIAQRCFENHQPIFFQAEMVGVQMKDISDFRRYGKDEKRES